MNNPIVPELRGLVLREAKSGEDDKILTVLTAEQGKISVYARGVRKLKSKYMSACSLYAYSVFSLKRGSDMYFLREAELCESFFGLRSSLPALALANYIACVACDVATEEQEEEALLSLALNSLYLLAEGKKDVAHIKAAFELRTASLCGFAPDLSGCCVCGRGREEEMYLDVMNGLLICAECKKSMNSSAPDMERDGTASIIIPLSLSVTEAMRYIAYSSPRRIFSFVIKNDDAPQLFDACEKYLLHHLERTFDALDFYKTAVTDG